MTRRAKKPRGVRDGFVEGLFVCLMIVLAASLVAELLVP